MNATENKYDQTYAADDADELVVIVMTRREWFHVDDWRAEVPERYPRRSEARRAAWEAIENAVPMREFLKSVTKPK
jgi:hypothetical protein